MITTGGTITEYSLAAGAAPYGITDGPDDVLTSYPYYGDDVLSALVNAEEDGDRLTHDQVVATSVLLTVARPYDCDCSEESE